MTDLESIKAKQKQTTIRQRQWETRRSNSIESQTNHCVCLSPKPSDDGFWLKATNTVQCANCGKAIFTADGTPITTLTQTSKD